MSAPIRIARNGNGGLLVAWSDGRTDNLTFQFLRDQCPCAGCKGETILGKTYMPTVPIPIVQSSYELAGIEPVGSYGVQIRWADGHATGIYAWDYLRLLGSQAAENEQGAKSEE